jgi:hypothetical protein
VPGREDDVDLEAGELESLAPLDGVFGVVGIEWSEAGPGDERVDVVEHELLDLRNPDLGAGRLRHRRDGTDVVEVRVREQDPLELHAQLPDRVQQGVGLVSRVHDQSAVGAVAPEDVRVLGHRADGEHPNVHDQRACLRRWRKR